MTDCAASVSHSFLPSRGDPRVIPDTWTDPSLEVCGTRSGSTVTINGSWSTDNGQGLEDGGFRYQLFDCTTAALVGETPPLVYNTGTPLTSAKTSKSFPIDRTHYYFVRAQGDGDLHEGLSVGGLVTDANAQFAHTFDLHPELEEQTTSDCF